jgi:hypothetical protein
MQRSLVRLRRPTLLPAGINGIPQDQTKTQSAIPPVANQMTVVMGEAKPDADNELFDPEELIFRQLPTR